MQPSMKSVLDSAHDFPQEPFYSVKASKLKHAVSRGWLEETIYLKYTFSIRVESSKDPGPLGFLVITLDENFQDLVVDLQVSSYL